MRIIFYRISQILVCLIPVVLGFMALLNNLSGYHDTVESVIKPLVTMSGTYHNPEQMWRHLPASFAAPLYVLMTCGETLVGVLAIIGFISMIFNIKNTEKFENSKSWVYLACGWGIIVWGLGFFTIGGEWFLAWENNNLSSFQQGAMLYVSMMLAVFLYVRLAPQIKEA